MKGGDAALLGLRIHREHSRHGAAGVSGDALRMRTVMLITVTYNIGGLVCWALNLCNARRHRYLLKLCSDIIH